MHVNREERCTAPSVPSSISADLTGYKWARDLVGESGGNVFRLYGKDGAPDLFLKHGKDTVADDITDELARLSWLKAYLPVPNVKHFTRTADEAWLLMTATPGETAYQVLEARPKARPAVVDALATFLLRIHAIPVSECPFTNDYAHRVVRARNRINLGLVEEDDFDDERQGWTSEQVWGALQNLLPLTPDQVVTHGDFSLDNLLICNGEVVGCIDVGRVGVADRYQDLSILRNCLGEFDASLQQRLLKQYGISEPDHDKLLFHLMLDELF